VLQELLALKMLWASKVFLFSKGLRSVEKHGADLPVASLLEVLELPMQRKQGWLEEACCCYVFAALGRVFLAAFLVFPEGIGHPAFTAASCFLGEIPPSRQ